MPKMFPLQKCDVSEIPWRVAEKAYQEYSRLYGTDQSLERLAERGGFGEWEMDNLYPNWRNELEPDPDSRDGV